MDQNNSTEYQDKELTCEDCKKLFLFTGRSQEFFARGGARDDEPAKEAWPAPKRCRVCRMKRKNKSRPQPHYTERPDGFDNY